MAILEFLEKNEGYKEFTDGEIRKNRMGDFKIVFENLKGEAKVSYKLKRHDFDFGCNLFMMDQYASEEDNQRYLDNWKKVFNTGVVPFYWEGTEPKRGLLRYSDNCGVDFYRRPPARRVVDFCKQNGIKAKGHPLFWHEFIPDWLPREWDKLLPLIEKRFSEISRLFADDVPVFDVLNEPSRIWDMTFEHKNDGYVMVAPPEGYVETILELGRKYFPNNQLILNDAVSASFCDFRGVYGGYYQLQKRLIDQGYKIDKIGLQCHTKDSPLFKNVFVAERLNSLLNTYGALGREVVISEISVPSGIGEDLQARALETIYRVAFSNPNVSGVFWWNLDDNGISTVVRPEALGENLPSSGIMRNGVAKKSYQVLDELVNEEWQSFGEKMSNGTLEFFGFFGDYELQVETAGRKYELTASFGKNAPREVRVAL